VSGWTGSFTAPKTCTIALGGAPTVQSSPNASACGTYTIPAVYPASCVVPTSEVDGSDILSGVGMNRSQLPPATDPASVTCITYCPFDGTCPPGMYTKNGAEIPGQAPTGYN